MINTPIGLCYLLKEELKVFFAETRYSDSMRQPNILVGKLPKKAAIFEPETIEDNFVIIDGGAPDIQVPETSEESIYPYIIIRPTDIADEEKSADSLGGIASITITVGSESYEDDGFLDVCSLIENIRRKVLEQERFGNAIIQKPLTASYPNFEDFRTQNYYFGDMFLKFEIPTVEKRRAFL